MATTAQAPTLPGIDVQKDDDSRRAPAKSEAAFRTISEVATELDVPQHVLRFWETKFTQIRPMKRGGGRRYYRPEDVALLRRIRGLLYDDGFTIKGVQKLLRDGAIKPLAAGEEAPPPPPVVEEMAAPVDLDDEPVSDPIAALEDKAATGSLSDRARAEIRDVIAELSAVRDLLAAR
ncbi:MerR family transcriptional regulator [Novispirillum sp. DQ9]|uniref:MerR family transcriptional regulator n=1 Tax=Novispirillum sp. DQ9 TaxID=3398612 RepID=UPI003C7DFE2C